MAEAARANEWIARARNRNQFQLVDEGRIGSDLVSGFALMAECQVRRHEDLPLRPDSHPLQYLLPAFDSPVAAREEMFVVIELFSVHERAAVLHDDKVLSRGRLTRASREH